MILILVVMMMMVILRKFQDLCGHFSHFQDIFLAQKPSCWLILDKNVRNHAWLLRQEDFPSAPAHSQS